MRSFGTVANTEGHKRRVEQCARLEIRPIHVCGNGSKMKGVSRRLLLGAVTGVLAVSLSACGFSDWNLEEPRQVSSFCSDTGDVAEQSFRKVDERRWVRRLKEFQSGCGVYRASVEIDISADDRLRWTYAFDYNVCNKCDQPMSLRTVQLGFAGASAAGHVEVDSLLRSGSRPIFALVDSQENRYISGCSRLSMIPLPVGPPTVVEYILEPNESASEQRQLPLYSLDHDVNGIQSDHMPYWESPIDYSSPLFGELWWGRLHEPSDSSETINAAHLSAACHAIGFPVLDRFETNVFSAFALQRIDSLALPNEVAELLPALVEDF